jgi:hypothetical protein
MKDLRLMGGLLALLCTHRRALAYETGIIRPLEVQRCCIYLFSWSRTDQPLLRALTSLYQPCMIYGDECGEISGIVEWQGEAKYSEETRSRASLFTTNNTLFYLGSNTGH